MADNYLEKRMDDYRTGRLGSSHSSSPFRRPSLFVHIIISVLDEAYVSDLLSTLRHAGAAVSFSGFDSRSGAALAQRSGTTFIPIDNPDAAIARARILRGMPTAVAVIDDCTASVTPFANAQSPTTHIIENTDRLTSKDLGYLIATLAKISIPLRIKERIFA